MYLNKYNHNYSFNETNQVSSYIEGQKDEDNPGTQSAIHQNEKDLNLVSSNYYDKHDIPYQLNPQIDKQKIGNIFDKSVFKMHFPAFPIDHDKNAKCENSFTTLLSKEVISGNDNRKKIRKRKRKNHEEKPKKTSQTEKLERFFNHLFILNVDTKLQIKYLLRFYEEFRKNPIYYHWERISRNDFRNRLYLLHKISRHWDDILREVNQHPEIYVKPIFLMIENDRKNNTEDKNE